MHLAAGTLVADDGRVLWAYSPDGSRHAVWKHANLGGPPVIAVAPGGRELAYVAPVPGAVEVLDDLRPNGHVVGLENGSIWLPPVFLRTGRGKVRLFSVDQNVDGDKGRLTMAASPAARIVPTHLLGGEWPTQVSGYPGTVNAALTVTRLDEDPHVNETLVDQDGGGAASRWTHFAQVGGSDGFYYPAWLAPSRVLIGSDHDQGDVTETLWDLCLHWSSRTIARFTPVRDPDDGAPNGETLPLDTWHALIVTAANPEVWSSLDVRTGAITPTAIRYQPIGWAVVPRPAPNPCPQ